jgi:hypothetical protein
MAAVLEIFTAEEQRFFRSFVEKRLSATGIHKEMFLVLGGKCLSHKAVSPWWQRFTDDGKVETELREWLEQQTKDFMLWVSTHW